MITVSVEVRSGANCFRIAVWAESIERGGPAGVALRGGLSPRSVTVTLRLAHCFYCIPTSQFINRSNEIGPTWQALPVEYCHLFREPSLSESTSFGNGGVFMR